MLVGTAILIVDVATKFRIPSSRHAFLGSIRETPLWGPFFNLLLDRLKRTFCIPKGGPNLDSHASYLRTGAC